MLTKDKWLNQTEISKRFGGHYDGKNKNVLIKLRCGIPFIHTSEIN